MKDAEVRKSEPRKTVQVTFPSGDVYEATKGVSLESFVRFRNNNKYEAVAALANGRLRELMFVPDRDMVCDPINLHSSEGIRIYCRSLTFMLVTVASEVFPETSVCVNYTTPFGGYYCRAMNRNPFTPEELARIENRMREVVEADEPIRRVLINLDEAKQIFSQRGESEKVALVERRTSLDCAMYELRGRRDMFYGYMVPSTGYLKYFSIVPYDHGFVIQYPQRQDPNILEPIKQSPMLTEVFDEYGEWLRVLRINYLARINDIIKEGRIKETILASEALQEQCVARIANEIAQNSDKVRLILIAGPSSSGKTTSSKRLAVQLLSNGIRPFTLEMDNYFVDREHTPKDEEGNYDFEALGALDLVRLNQDLVSLLSGKETQLPRFNFITAKRELGEVVKLGKDQVIIAEGIHGLNPELVTSVPKEAVYRMYVSALTQLNIDRHNRVSTTDTRLIRRIVRDSRTRGWSAENTLDMWDRVRRGEKNNIFPYQENANAMFNSALVYELSALKPFAEPMLMQVRPSSRMYIAARRLLSFLGLVEPLSTELIPANSILREFVGGSIFEKYLPGKDLNW